ncbi:unnamed protein product [Knipowitschia caucasica]
MTSVGTQTRRLQPSNINTAEADFVLMTPMVPIVRTSTNSVDSSWCIRRMMKDIESEMSEMEDSQEAQVCDKFIVCKDQLMSLFTKLPACFEEAPGVIQRQEGTFIKNKAGKRIFVGCKRHNI